MSSDPSLPAAAPLAVEIAGLGKCYHIYASPRDRLRQLTARFTRRNYFREFWALKDVSFQVPRGQTIGIVGPNGSGKSTLLQLIAGTLTPTRGTLAVHGRISALLELGSGFNPEFTGRENVYMNGAIIGFSRREIDRRFDSITSFADIGDFIDQPVKKYSSGMFVRLAFSVAVNVDPEILIVDEALAVGDIRFQARCFRRFAELQKAGKTILFVSHTIEHIVRHCSAALLFDKGVLLAQGEPRDICNQYMHLLFGGQPGPAPALPSVGAARSGLDAPLQGPPPEPDDPILAAFMSPASPDAFETRSGYNKLEYRWGEHSAQIVDYLLRTPAGCDVNQLESGECLDVFVKVRYRIAVACPIFGVVIKSPDGVVIFGVNSRDREVAHVFRPCREGELVVVHFRVQALLSPADYLITLGTSCEQGGQVVPLDRRQDAVVLHVAGPRQSSGVAALPHSFERFSLAVPQFTP